ncbi:uncharacterized, partial [Tachysurus ichikawai]
DQDVLQDTRTVAMTLWEASDQPSDLNSGVGTEAESD